MKPMRRAVVVGGILILAVLAALLVVKRTPGLHTEETGAREVFLNPSRRWTFDQLDVYEDGIERTFGGIKMTWMGVVPVTELQKGVTKGGLQLRTMTKRIG